MRVVPRLCEFYPGIYPTTEEKSRKTLSQGKKNLSQSTVICKILSTLKALERSRLNELGRGSKGLGPCLGFEVHAAAICIAPFWVVTPSCLVGG